MRTVEDALSLRQVILGNIEAALKTDYFNKQSLLTFIIVGGGTTGVELAGAITELINGSLCKDYPELNFEDVEIILIHSGKNLLPSFPENLGLYTLRHLSKIGVNVCLNRRVCSITDDQVLLDDHSIIRSRSVIWTAGTEGLPLLSHDDLELTERKQVIVESTLQLKNYPDVYAIGDVASYTTGKHPMLGINCSRSIAARSRCCKEFEEAVEGKRT